MGSTMKQFVARRSACFGKSVLPSTGDQLIPSTKSVVTNTLVGAGTHYNGTRGLADGRDERGREKEFGRNVTRGLAWDFYMLIL